MLAVAHRAGNDLDRLREAEDYGAHLVEADLHLHRGRVEVRHLKTLGPVPLLWDRWYVVSASSPRLLLGDVLAAAAPATRFMFDLKGVDPSLARALRTAMHELDPARPYTVCSKGWRQLDVFRHDAHVQVVHSIGSEAALRRVPRALTWHDRHAVSVHHKLLSAPRVATLRELAPLVMTWPVNTPERLQEVAGWGVTGVISDEPALLKSLLAAPQG